MTMHSSLCRKTNRVRKLPMNLSKMNKWSKLTCAMSRIRSHPQTKLQMKLRIAHQNQTTRKLRNECLSNFTGKRTRKRAYKTDVIALTLVI